MVRAALLFVVVSVAVGLVGLLSSLLSPDRSTLVRPVLVTQWYGEPSAPRRAELLTALLANIANGEFAHIYIVLGDATAVWPPVNVPAAAAAAVERTTAVRLPLGPHGRPLLSSLLRYCNEHLSHRPVVIANTDILFDASVRLLANDSLLFAYRNTSRLAYFLSRYAT